MDANAVYALIALIITIVFLSFLLGMNLNKLNAEKEIARLRAKVKKLKYKRKKNG